MARNSKKLQLRETVALVGDGQMERIYFSDVRDTDRPANLSIFPDYPKKIGSYTGVLERAIELVASYSRVYALVDMDKIVHDKKLQDYTNAKAKAESAGVIVLENNPCFEIWLLLHFMTTGKAFHNCDQVATLLKRNKHIPNYEKSEKFLVAARLYKNYKEKLKQHAVPNARQLENQREGQGPFFPRAETFRFFEWYFQTGL